jgi:hypothetical protein
MGVLANPDHERFCQEVHRLILDGQKRCVAYTAAYREHIYKGGDASDDDIGPNARRLSQQGPIRGRITELLNYSSKLAAIDASWALLILKRRVERIDRFNLDDYMPGRAEGRGFDVSQATREEIARLGEMAIEEEVIKVGAEKEIGTLRKIKLKGYADIDGPLRLMAQIAGWLAPAKAELTGADGAPLVPTINLSGRPEFMAETEPAE